MVRYLIRVGYIGTKYRGTQKIQDFQNETIQDVLESALLTLKLKNEPLTHFASRTDKGVHALMNALHVDLEHKISGEVYQPHQIRMKLNSYLTENNHEIVVKNCCIVPDSFHARFHAKQRSYYYRVAILKNGLIIPVRSDCHQGYLPTTEINRCHIVSSQLNTSIVKRVADLYCGEHDFASFTKYLSREPWKNTKRVIDECCFYETSFKGSINDSHYENISMWEFHIRSRSFLYHQVRKLVGAALFAGFGIISLPEIQAMFDDPNPEKPTKYRMAPACGLFLGNVHYAPEDFNNWSLSTKEKTETEDVNMVYKKLLFTLYKYLHK